MRRAMNRNPAIVLDYHGFRRRIEPTSPLLHALGDRITVPILGRLSAIPDAAEGLDAIRWLTFERDPARRDLYRCAGCLHCDPETLTAACATGPPQRRWLPVFDGKPAAGGRALGRAARRRDPLTPGGRQG